MPDAASDAAKFRRRILRLAYQRDLMRGAAPRLGSDRLGQAQPHELEERFRQAWRLHDLGELEQVGGALHARGLLRPTDARRLRAVRVMLGRPTAALEIAPPSPATPWDLMALAGAGRMEEARSGLAGIHHDLDADTLALLRRAIGEAPEAPWDLEAGRIAAALELRCGDLAADLAAQALDEAVPEGEELMLALVVLQCCFRMASPLAARRLLEAMRPLYGAADQAAYEAVGRLAEGGWDDGPLMAARAAEEPRFTLAYVLAHACAGIGRDDAAVRRLCGFRALDLGAATEHLFEFARLVGAAERLEPRFAEPSGRRKVFDVFPFNGEFGLLDLKLETMRDRIDRFVLVEAERTFTGNPKPLYFQDARDRYAAWADRIVHVVAEAEPAFVQSAWAREYHQRDQGVRGLSGLCAPEDLVLISDVDEIVDPAVLDGFRQPFASVGMRTFVYFLNYERIADRGVRRKVGIVEARMLEGAGLSGLRVGMWAYAKACIENGGWHFSSILTPEDIELKVRSYSHEEHQLDGSAAIYRRELERIRDGWRDPGFARVPIDQTFPASLRERPERYLDFILAEDAS
jgi:hypothetical protein